MISGYIENFMCAFLKHDRANKGFGKHGDSVIALY